MTQETEAVQPNNEQAESTTAEINETVETKTAQEINEIYSRAT